MSKKHKTATKAPTKAAENKAKATKSPELASLPTSQEPTKSKTDIQSSEPVKTDVNTAASSKQGKKAALPTDKITDVKTPTSSIQDSTLPKQEKKKKKKKKAASASDKGTTSNDATESKTSKATPMQVDDDIKEPAFATQTPPHNLHLNRFQNVVKCIITLHHIPDQCIKFEPTSTHVYLDTFKFSKKFLLRVPYPEEVEVDPENVEATLENGVLKCDFPITKDPHKPKNYDKVIQRRYKLDSMDNKTRKQFLAQEREKKAKKKNKSKKKADGENGDQEVDNTDTSNKKRKLSSDDNPNPSKKRFLDTSEAALDIAKQINREQEQKAREKAELDYQKLSFATKKKLERRERREGILAAKKAKKSDMEKLMSAKDKRKQNKEKKKQHSEELNKRVSFGDK